MNRPGILLVSIMLLTGTASLCLTYCWQGPRPVIVVPETLDVGVQTLGTTVHAPFTVRNAGGAPLLLDSFRTNCGCLNITGLRDGSYSPLEQATIPPGEQLILRSGLVANGRSGEQLRTWLRFATNDPDRPEVTVHFVTELQGAVVAVPSVLALGDLQPGEVVTRRLLIRDMGRRAPFCLDRIRSNVPDIVTVVKATQLAASADQMDKLVTGAALTHTAVLKVTAPVQLGPIGGRLDVLEVGSTTPLLQVPITGQVVPRFQISPDSLVFPRRSANGLLYTATCFCTCTSGKPFSLTLLSTPPGVTASAKKLTDSRYAIEVAADATTKPNGKPQAVSFQAVGPRGTEDLALCVRVTSAD